MTESIRTLHTSQLTPADLAAIRSLLHDAFDGDFGEEDWDHTLGGMHVLLHESENGSANESGDALVAHGSVIMRRVTHGGRSYRIGYVEALAVRADRRRQGLGGRAMDALEQIIVRSYAFGALSASDEGAALYRSRGWRLWRGRIEGLGPDGPVRFPDEEDSTFVLGPSPDPADSPLAFDWRDGDVL
ncbi:GNAT family N-acetyltransferase [Streptomyces sp. NPDC014894]|uniref:GNAT family N-acetyltransferase n=1 Tax=Streptomyces sp. NPDC014894 TaxID=3364931 RepID=UPI0036FC1376